jgi:hypothetical protein
MSSKQNPTNEESFMAWMRNPARTVEELYGAELMIEFVEEHVQPGRPEKLPRDLRKVLEKIRRIDPAYCPDIARYRIRDIGKLLPTLEYLSVGGYGVRPLRNISFAKYLPGLKKLSCHGTILDWSPLVELRSLEDLTIHDEQSVDLRPIGQLKQLKSLSLTLYKPWPNLNGFENMESLTDLRYLGNNLALEAVPYFPSVRRAFLGSGRFNLPIQKISQLPAMPELRRLILVQACDLTGVERYEKLQNLDVDGLYRDLTPLSGLHDLTHLTLKTCETPPLNPIATLGSLRHITLKIEIPPDLVPLTELPMLRRVEVMDTPIVRVEQSSINALCNSWDDDFTVDPPRKLPPLKMWLETPPKYKAFQVVANPRDWSDDLEMGYSEARWFHALVKRRIKRLLGKDWVPPELRRFASAGHYWMKITQHDHISRVPEIVTALRKIIAKARYPWAVSLSINTLDRYRVEINTLTDEEYAEIELKEERREAADREEHLKRLYERELTEDSGIEYFSRGVVCDPPEEEFDDDDDDDDDHPFLELTDQYNLGTELSVYAEIRETGIFTHLRTKEQAEMLFEIKAEPD